MPRPPVSDPKTLGLKIHAKKSKEMKNKNEVSGKIRANEFDNTCCLAGEGGEKKK